VIDNVLTRTSGVISNGNDSTCRVVGLVVDLNHLIADNWIGPAACRQLNSDVIVCVRCVCIQTGCSRSSNDRPNPPDLVYGVGAARRGNTQQNHRSKVEYAGLIMIYQSCGGGKCFTGKLRN